jgi:hypothetical protein
MFKYYFIHDFYPPRRDVALCFCHSCIRSFERHFCIWGLKLLVVYRFYVLNNYFRLGFRHCISLSWKESQETHLWGGNSKKNPWAYWTIAEYQYVALDVNVSIIVSRMCSAFTVHIFYPHLTRREHVVFLLRITCPPPYETSQQIYMNNWPFNNFIFDCPNEATRCLESYSNQTTTTIYKKHCDDAKKNTHCNTTLLVGCVRANMTIVTKLNRLLYLQPENIDDA